MAEYIDREALLRAINKIGGSPLREWDTWGVVSLVANQPAANVAPVVRGKWIRDDGSYYVDGYIAFYDFHCSVCGETVVDRHGLPNYCPWCGAKMEENDD